MYMKSGFLIFLLVSLNVHKFFMETDRKSAVVKIEKNYRATRVYKYILQSEDCIVLHWGKGNRFRSLRPTFLEDKLKEKESMTRLYTIAV